MLHVQTIILFASVIQIVLIGVLFIVWRYYKDIPGIRSWLLSFGCALAGFFLFFGRPFLPSFLTIMVANALLMQGGYLNAVAINKYVGGKPFHPAWHYSFLSAYVLALGYFLYITPDFAMRCVAFSVYYSILYAAAGIIAYRKSKRSHWSRRLFGNICFFNAAYHVARVVWNFTEYREHVLSENAAFLTRATFMETVVLSMLFVIAIILLIAEDKAHHLKRLSEFDHLTRIFNRNAFMVLLGKAARRREREGGPLSIMMADLDHFKRVNDTYGHAVGDDALRHFVGLANAVLRKEEILGRLGGEEFAVFLPGTSEQSAVSVAERIRKACSDAMMVSNGHEVRLTVSIGVAEMGEESATSLLHRADKALYKAKELGRNRVVAASTMEDEEEGISLDKEARAVY